MVNVAILPVLYLLFFAKYDYYNSAKNLELYTLILILFICYRLAVSKYFNVKPLKYLGCDEIINNDNLPKRVDDYINKSNIMFVSYIIFYIVYIAFVAFVFITPYDSDEILTSGISDAVKLRTQISSSEVDINAQDYEIVHSSDNETIRLRMWDFAEKDEDKVSVFVDDKQKLSYIELKDRYYEYEVPANSKITIKADAVGDNYNVIKLT